MEPYAADDVKRKKRRFENFKDRERIPGVIICDSNGLPIDSNLEIEVSEEVAVYVTSLIEKTRQLTEALNEGSLKSIRLETSIGEVMVELQENLIIIIWKEFSIVKA
ncbi:hypothetical protein LCGC14_1869420 [marine sediment metagenome]|uniref:Roadblock/LAMTOR2 domain-containing protein n=1 Tax=marine sediment metagenome TaxID=412755 RepID=A0A0F9G5C4_9ZZZZ